MKRLFFLAGWLLPATALAQSPPEAGDLQLTEAMVNSAHGTEWFEIKNVSGGPVELEGCCIGDRGGSQNSDLIDQSLVIPAGGLAVFSSTDDFGDCTGGTPRVDFDYSGLSLTNDDVIYVACAAAGGSIDDCAPTETDDALDVLTVDYAQDDAGTSKGEAITLCSDGSYSPPDPDQAFVCTDPDDETSTNLASPGSEGRCARDVARDWPSPGGVIFNEINPAPDFGAEWIELYIWSESDVDLASCELGRVDGDGNIDRSWIFPVTAVELRSDSYLLLAVGDLDGKDTPDIDFEYSSISLPNSDPSRLRLSCPESAGGALRVIDEIALDAPADKGRSLQFNQDVLATAPDGSFANDDEDNWCAATTGDQDPGYEEADPEDAENPKVNFGTPGAPNACPPPPMRPPVGAVAFTEVMVGPDFGDEWVEVYNTDVAAYDLNGCEILRLVPDDENPGSFSETRFEIVVSGSPPAQIQPGEYFLIHGGTLASADVTDSPATANLSLSNDGCFDLVLDCGGVVIDRFSLPRGEKAFSIGVPPEEVGRALADRNDDPSVLCKPAGSDRYAPSEADDAGKINFGSPGRANACDTESPLRQCDGTGGDNNNGTGNRDVPTELDRNRDDSAVACNCRGAAPGASALWLGLWGLGLLMLRRRRR